MVYLGDDGCVWLQDEDNGFKFSEKKKRQSVLISQPNMDPEKNDQSTVHLSGFVHSAQHFWTTTQGRNGIGQASMAGQGENKPSI